MEIVYLSVYLVIGICMALYMYYDINGEGGYSSYIFLICLWPIIVLIGIIIRIIDWINQNMGGPSIFA